MGSISKAGDWWKRKTWPFNWWGDKANSRWYEYEGMEVREFHDNYLAHQFHGAYNWKTFFIFTNCLRCMGGNSWYILGFGKLISNSRVKIQALVVKARRSWGNRVLQWNDDTIARTRFVLWRWMGLPLMTVLDTWREKRMTEFLSSWLDSTKTWTW